MSQSSSLSSENLPSDPVKRFMKIFDDDVIKNTNLLSHHQNTIDRDEVLMMESPAKTVAAQDQFRRRKARLTWDIILRRQAMFMFCFNPNIGNPISPIASIIHLWRSSSASSPSSLLDNLLSPFYDNLQHLLLRDLPKTTVYQSMTCSFVLPSSSSPEEQEACERFLSETFLASRQLLEQKQKHNPLLLLDAPVVFTTSTMKCPHFLGSSHDHPTLIYKIVSGDETGIECADVSEFCGVDTHKSSSMYIPSSFPMLFEVQGSVKIGKKFVVTLKKTMKKNDTTGSEEEVLSILPPPHSSLVASNIQTNKFSAAEAAWWNIDEIGQLDHRTHIIDDIGQLDHRTHIFTFKENTKNAKNTSLMDDIKKVVVFAKSCRESIEGFCLKRCIGISDDTLLLLRSVPMLKSLDISNCGNITDVGVRNIAANCANLTSLNLRNCNKITNVGLQAIAAKLTNLTSLDLSYCENITDAGLQAVAANCVNLTSLNLECCNKITDAGLQAIAATCVNLTWLNLQNCHEITDASLQAIAATCANLTWLSLLDCHKITDAGLQAIAATCVNLTALNLADCRNITDVSLQVIAAKLVNLTYLNLGSCEDITDAGIQAIAANCVKLTELQLTWCHAITDAAKERAKQSIPGLYING